MRKLLFGHLLAFMSALAVLTAGRASAASSIVGHVYVNDNTTGVNTIGALDRHADGTLTPKPGVAVFHRWSRYRQGGSITGGAATQQ